MLDTYERTELTGPWAGFGFQGHSFFTPEGHDLKPEDLTWLSLTCNIAREWRMMMEDARSAIPGNADAARLSGNGSPAGEVIHLRHVLLRRKERRLSTMGGARFADTATAVRATRRPSRYRRG